jgi:hypothetical protein
MKFVCFHCRKVFNKPGDEVKIGPTSHNHSWTPPDYRRCECGESLHLTGSEFRPPPRRATDQWSKAELLIRSGFLFHKGVGPYPETLWEARAFVRQHKRPKDATEAINLAKERRMSKQSTRASRSRVCHTGL